MKRMALEEEGEEGDRGRSRDSGSAKALRKASNSSFDPEL